MRITNQTKTKWVATETARGFKVRLHAGETHDVGRDLFFDSIETVQAHIKGEITVVKRKVTTSKETIKSE